MLKELSIGYINHSRGNILQFYKQKDSFCLLTIFLADLELVEFACVRNSCGRDVEGIHAKSLKHESYN